MEAEGIVVVGVDAHFAIGVGRRDKLGKRVEIDGLGCDFNMDGFGLWLSYELGSLRLD